MRVGWFGVYWNLETFGKKKKTVPADEPLPTAISFFNFRLHPSVNPNWFSNTPTLILCSPESVFEHPYLDPL